MEQIAEERSLEQYDFAFLNEKYQRLRNLLKFVVLQNENEKDSKLIQEIRVIEEEMVSKIDDLADSNEEFRLRSSAMKMALLYERSKLLVAVKQEHRAEEILCKACNDVKSILSKPEIIFIGLKLMNHYAYLLSKKSDFAGAKDVLESSKSSYETLKSDQQLIPFYTNDELFAIELPKVKKSNDKLEQAMTNNLQMLAFVYNKLELDDKYVACLHQVLDRQLLFHNTEVTNWATKCTHLASHFLENKKYNEARHYLAAATQVLYLHENELKNTETLNEKISKWKNLQRTFANVANCWVRYDLFLFSASKNNLISQAGQRMSNPENIWPLKSGSDPNYLQKQTTSFKEARSNLSPRKNKGKLYFVSLELSEYEDTVTDSLIETTEEARKLYLHANSWIKKAQVFFTLNDHPMEYVNSILDLSELYRFLIFFETELESQYNIQKLRAECIETLCKLLKEVRPRCYLMVSIELYRELAEVQLEMMGLNLKRICVIREDAPDHCELAVNKVEALSDVYSKLDKFSDHLEHDYSDSLKDSNQFIKM